MEQKGINASQLATKLNIQRSTLSHLLSGRNKPSVELLTKLCSYFKVSADYLLFGESRVEESVAKKEIVNPNKDSQTRQAQAIPQQQLQFKEEEPTPYGDKSVYNNKQPSKTEIKRVILLKADGSFESYEP